MRLIKHCLFLFLMFMSVYSFGQTCATNPGEGPDIPKNISVNGRCVPFDGSFITLTSWFNNVPNHVQVCYDTVGTGDTMVQVDYSNNDYSAASAFMKVYDPTLVTRHCSDIGNFLPGGKRYLINVDSCGAAGGGGPPPLRCTRGSVLNSIAPAGSGQSKGVQFKTPNTNPAATLSWDFIPRGATKIYKGNAVNVDLIGMWHDGPLPAWIYATNLSVDSQPCTAALAGATCGSTHISLVLDGNSGETIRPATNNYNVTIPSSGAYAGKFGVGGSADYIQSYIFTQPGAMLRIITDSSTSTGSHTITGNFQATNSTQQNMGVPSSISYTFTVLPTATFTAVAPTIFPPIPGDAKWNSLIAKTATLKFNCFKDQNLNQGLYNNDNFSSTLTALDCWDVFNYSGERVAFQFADYLRDVVTDWQPNHLYAVGDIICTNGAGKCASGTQYIEIVTAITTGQSGTTRPNFASTTPGVPITSVGVTYTNGGHTAYWNEMAQRVLMQTMNWELVMPKTSTWAEWNLFPWGTEYDYYREGGALSENCNGSGSCLDLQKKALAYLASPLISTPGVSTQGIVWTYKFTPPGTIRALPYSLGLLSANWLVRNTPVVNGNVDEGKARTDLLLQTVQELVDYNPISTSGEFPCCISAPSFDLGLLAEELIHIYTVQAYQQAHGQPVVPDARIPIQLLELGSWFKINEYNLTGTDFLAPYSLWITPANINTYNYLSNASLNNLIAPMYAWLGSVYGDNCMLSDGSHCWDVADSMYQHTLDPGFFRAKDVNQAYKWWYDFKGWRTGTMTGSQSSVLPNFNTNRGTIPDQFEPYNGGDYPTGYPTCTPTSSTLSCRWYMYEYAPTTLIKTGTSVGNWTKTTICGPSVFVVGSDNLWLATCMVINLNPSTKYYTGFGATDAAGNAAFSATNPDNNATYSTTTSGGSGLIIVSHFLPNGTKDEPYDQFLVASGGQTPYTWVRTQGSLPTGLVLETSGEIHGTPTVAGLYAFFVKVTDHNGLFKTGPISITIDESGLTVITKTLLPGVQNTPYVATLLAGGGAEPYSWDITDGTLPLGISLDIFGTISGTPTESGTFNFTVRVTDADQQQATQPLQLFISSQGATVTLITTTLGNAVVDRLYNFLLRAVGGTPPYSFQLVP